MTTRHGKAGGDAGLPDSKVVLPSTSVPVDTLTSRRFQESVYASLTRAMQAAPLHRKPANLRLMARNARIDVDNIAQLYLDGLVYVAEAEGLYDLLGEVAVHDCIMAGF